LPPLEEKGTGVAAAPKVEGKGKMTVSARSEVRSQVVCPERAEPRSGPMKRGGAQFVRRDNRKKKKDEGIV